MALQRQNLTRVFLYAGMRLPDPDSSMSPIEVRDFLASAGRAEISNAEVRGPEVVGNEMQYTLHRAVGTKGLETDTAQQSDVLDITNIAVPDWITQRMDVFAANTAKFVREVNSGVAALLTPATDLTSDTIKPPGSVLPWFF